MIITGAGKNRTDVLRVRCKCMAEYKNVSDRFYNYDWLGEAVTIPDALAIYNDHIGKEADNA
jgi:hypothetical protein